MTVPNIFYHISRLKEGQQLLDSSDEFKWPGERNYTSKQLYNFKPKGKFIDCIKYGYYEKAPDKQEYLNCVRNTFSWVNRKYWEIVFEKARKDNFSKRPSRFSCMFLSFKENIEEWQQSLSMGFHFPPKVYQIQVEGNIHIADKRWLPNDVERENTIIDYATCYWRGESFNGNNSCPEILFEGKMKILKRHASLDEFKKFLEPPE